MTRQSRWAVWALVILVVVAIGLGFLRLARQSRDISPTLVNVLVSPNGNLDVLILLANPHSAPVGDIVCDLTFYNERGEPITGIRSTDLSTEEIIPPGSKRPTVFALGSLTDTIAEMDGTCVGEIRE